MDTKMKCAMDSALAYVLQLSPDDFLKEARDAMSGEVCQFLIITGEEKMKDEEEFVPTYKDIVMEAQIKYDAVCEARMEMGQEMPWWSELPEEVVADYLRKAKERLIRRHAAIVQLDKINRADIIAYLEDKGYDVSRDLVEEWGDIL